jgi:hypothetical protein
MPEPRLAPLPGGKLKIHAEHFRKVVRRIECIKPLAGYGIRVTETEDGILIKNAGDLIELTVCKDGAPATIYVFGYESNQFQDEFLNPPS